MFYSNAFEYICGLSCLQREIEELRHNLANISNNSDDSAQKLKEEYLQKLNALETQVNDNEKLPSKLTSLFPFLLCSL